MTTQRRRTTKKKSARTSRAKLAATARKRRAAAATALVTAEPPAATKEAARPAEQEVQARLGPADALEAVKEALADSGKPLPLSRGSRTRLIESCMREPEFRSRVISRFVGNFG